MWEWAQAQVPVYVPRSSSQMEVVGAQCLW